MSLNYWCTYLQRGFLYILVLRILLNDLNVFITIRIKWFSKFNLQYWNENISKSLYVNILKCFCSK